MAKKSISNDSLNIKKIKPDKQAFYAKLKYLSKWLFAPDKLPIEPLVEDKKEFESNLKYRLYNNFLSYPKLIWYFNKYLNNLYDFHSFHPEDLLRTVATVIRIYGLTNSGQLYFSKYQQFKRDSFSNILDKYGKEISAPLNSQEVQCLYKLFEIGIIKTEDFENIENIVDGKEKNRSTSSQYANMPVTPQYTNNVSQTKSAEIISLCNSIINFKNKRQICKTCPLAHKQSSVLDTNIVALDQAPVDVALVVNDTAMSEDILSQSPMSADNMSGFKNAFYGMVKKHNLKYVITNASLCYPENKTLSPADLKKVLSNCKGLIDEVHSVFKPKIFILLGTNVIKNYGIKEKLSEINGELVYNKYFCMPSVEEASKSKTAMDRYQKAVLLLDHQLGKLVHQKSIDSVATDHSEYKSLTITEVRIEKGDTLFNVEVLNDQLIYILIDSKGKKKIIVEDIKYPVYIKSGQYQNCDYITDNVEAVALLTAKQKQQLSSKLNQHLKSMIEC